MRRAFLSFAILVVVSAVSAQEQPTGVPPFSSIQSIGMDAINRQNLNANFSIPIVSSPGRGLNFSFPITNDSLLWMKQNNAWTPVVDGVGNPTWGWKDTVPAGMLRYSNVNEACDSPPPIQYSHHYSNFSYIDPAGTTHRFAVDFYLTPTICSFNTGPRTGYALDDSGYYLDATTPSSPKVTAPNGKVITGANWTDSNGNFFSATVVSGSETDWKDSAGHIPLKIVTSAGSIQYQYPDNTGAYQHSTLILTSTNIKTNFACSGVAEYTGTASLPTELDLANGQKYFFTYEPTPGQSGYYTGRIKRVTLPDGGYLEHQYNGSNDSINCSDGSVTNLSLLVNDGTNTSTWTLTRAQNGSNWNTTVTAPQLSYDTAANQSVFTFNSLGQEITEKFYQGSTSGTLLRTINTTWSSGTPATQITILEDNSTQNEVETTYDSYGNLTTLKEHDWGPGAPGSIVRTTATLFLNSSAYLAANIVNRPISILVKDGNGVAKALTTIAYDESGYINTSCPTGATQHNDSAYGCSYTTRGNATTVTTYTDPVTPGGAIAKHSYYDFFGNLVKADLNCCQQKTWTYSATTNYAFPDSATSGSSAPQLTTSATYNSYTGLVATTTDENGQVTSFDYSDSGHLNRLMTVTRPDSAQITYSYDDTNHTVQVTSPIQGTNVVRQKTFANGLAQPIKQQLLDVSNASYSITETQYDAWNRAYKVSNPHNSTAQYWTESRTDAIGRLTKTILQDNSQNATSYSTTSATTTDPAGKQKKSVSDGLGRLVKVFEPDVANGNALTIETDYAYTVLDALTTVTQGAQTRTFLYDALGRLTDSTTPEAGHFQFQYNTYNLLTQRTDPRGVITTYGYDSLNRPYTITYNVGSTGVPSPGNVTLTYGTSSASNTNGRLITMTDGVGSENYSYDILGQPTQLQKTIGTTTYTTQYAYNLAGELTSITYPSNRVVQQSFDIIGRLCAVGASGSTCSTGTTYASGFSYNNAFQVTGLSYGNGVTATFGFSADRMQLSSLAYAKGASALFGLNYSYGTSGSNNGQIAGITDNVDNGRTAAYSYDALYRLTNASTTGSANYPAWGLGMTYDRYGNRTQQATSSGCVAPMTCPTNSVTVSASTNQLVSPYAYDANGNMTNDGQNTLVYDAENHAVSSSGSLGFGSYAYDGNGLRIKKVSGSTTTVYVFSGSKVIAEYVNGAAPGFPAREYLYAGATLIAKIESSAAKYYHQDHLSNRVVTDSTGTTTAQMGHYPFGESWYNASNDKLQFTSYERDSESGNDYARARYYVSRFGRFSSPDPLAGTILDPQSLNRYAYVANQPTGLVDPSGTCDELIDAKHQYRKWRYELQVAGMGPSDLAFELDLYADQEPGGAPCDLNGGGGGGIPLDANNPPLDLCAGNLDYCTTVTPPRTDSSSPPLDYNPFDPSVSPPIIYPVNQITPGGGGGNTSSTLKKVLREILKNKDCAALLGGTDKANQILDHFLGTVNVDTQQSTGNLFNLAKPLIDSVTKPTVAVTFTPAAGNFTNGQFTGPNFSTFVGATFAGYNPSAQLTVEMHEFIHAASSPLTNKLFVDMMMPNIPGKPSNRIANIYQISKNCGTALPPGF